MKENNFDLVIIGAGLTGLTLAYFMRNKGLKIGVLEGRNRLGGRILTIDNNDTLIEMGATWINNQHSSLLALLDELKLHTFEQEIGKSAFYELNQNTAHQLVPLPPNNESSLRIQGGTSGLINVLQKHFVNTELQLNCTVNSLIEKEGSIIIETDQGEFEANQVVSTLPPYLFIKTIKTDPDLPNNLVQSALNTHTWMGESIKIGLSYSNPFWKENSISGTVFSNDGPITEMYDHTDYEHNRFALKGFLHPAYPSISKAERCAIVLKQLEKYYGPIVKQYFSYQELIWQKEKFTFSAYDQHLFPHQNNGHTAYRASYFNEKLYVAGSETAKSFPGYMEGAIQSAREIAKKLAVKL